MSKNILIGVAIAGALLTATSCRGKVTINGTKGTDTLEFNTDSIREININVQSNGYEEGEADDSEAQGLAPYEEQTIPLSKLPQTAQQQARISNQVLYINAEQQPNEDDGTGIYTVWLADEKTKTARRILTTNPTAAGMWDEMKEKNGGVSVEMHLIATAEKAQFASADGKKIIVEGCPDGRNTWTYLIDLDKRKAMQLPGTEGVQSIDMKRKEIIIASYGYNPAPDYGRYTVNKAYSFNGKFLRQVGEPQPE